MKISNLFFLVPVVLGLSTMGPLHAQVCKDTNPGFSGGTGVSTPTLSGCTVNGQFNRPCIGTDGNDTITGGGGQQTIVGRKGDDVIQGGPFRDIICAGDGKDVVVGGFGDDDLMGGDGKDTLDGGFGNNWLDGGRKQDRCLNFTAKKDCEL